MRFLGNSALPIQSAEVKQSSESKVLGCYSSDGIFIGEKTINKIQFFAVAYPQSNVRFSWHSTEPVRFVSSVTLPELRIASMLTHQCHVEGKLSRLISLFRTKPFLKNSSFSLKNTGSGKRFTKRLSLQTSKKYY